MEFKSPDATLDYRQDWSDWLGTGDTIVTSGWTVETGITIDSEANSSTAATCVLSGGTLGKTYKIENTITTANGLDETMEWFLKIQNRLA